MAPYFKIVAVQFVVTTISIMHSLSIAIAQEPPKIRDNDVVLTYGELKGGHAIVTFDKNRAAKTALKIETFLAGVAGSKVSIFIDKDPNAIFFHTLTTDECRFGEQGSTCIIVLQGRVAAYGRLIHGFRNGRISRLQIETGGVMAMSHTASLNGFKQATQNIDD